MCGFVCILLVNAARNRMTQCWIAAKRWASEPLCRTSVCGCVCGEWVFFFFLALAPLVDIKMNEGAAYYHTDVTCI